MQTNGYITYGLYTICFDKLSFLLGKNYRTHCSQKSCKSWGCSENQKTMEQKDDTLAISCWFRCCYKANIVTSNLAKHYLSEKGLFTL